MIVDGNASDALKPYECDVCILGAGVAGIVLANELKDAFEKIIIVESGDENYTQEVQDLYAPEEIPKQYPNPLYSRMRFLGGSSNHWNNNTSPLSPIDFEKREWIPNSGWPISYADVASFYQKAAWYCGVGEDGYDTVYWSSLLNKADVIEASDILETQIAKHSTPPVRFFQSYKRSLLDSGKILILKNSNVIGVELESKKISSVKIISNNGKSSVVYSRLFIMCLGGIENARILLIFNEKHNNQLGNQDGSVGRYFMGHPTPRAAQLLVQDPEVFSLYQYTSLESKNIQGYITLSESTLERYQTTNLRMPLIPATNYMLSDGISSYHTLSESMSRGEIPDSFGRHILNFIGDLDMVGEAIYRKKWDDKWLDSAGEFGGFQMPMMMEQTPSRDNRVRLGSQVDSLGLKKILIDWVLADDDRKKVWKTLDVVANEIGAMSLGRMKLLKERASRIWGDQLGFSSHHIGTTRMADDPKTGVVDKHQRVFGVNNLFVNGSSVFSTGGHVPPTLTIAALSIRLARYLESEHAND